MLDIADGSSVGAEVVTGVEGAPVGVLEVSTHFCLPKGLCTGEPKL